MVRTVRNVLNILVPLVGMMVVFSSVLWIDDLSLQMMLVILGVLMIQSVTWKLTNPFFPSERKFTELRAETDEFVDLVRQLNAAAVMAREVGTMHDWEHYEAVLASMHRSVDRMGALAGKEVDATPTAAPEHGPDVAPATPF